MADKPYFDPVDPKVSFPALEEEILGFWKKNRIFEKSVEMRSESKKWTFLDGPPFITGLPHYGSLLSSIPKDLFPRFWTMKGYRVRRVWGWDCHGLPAENKVEAKLGIKRKKDIEGKVGVKKFIDECKAYVGQVSSEWEWYVDHVGRWVDFKNAYKTMDLPYMETVMWVFKSMYEKSFVYKGLRVSLYCPHCSTPISNFEVAMDADNYKDLTEPANVYKYQLKGSPDTFFLAWSTTPWNKLVTTALAVNPKLQYVKVKQGNESYILAKSTLKILKDDSKYKILEEFSGKDLIGRQFTPHYEFFDLERNKKAFVVAGGDFVSADEGTGIVTIAPYGEEDLELMQKENIQVVLHVDDEGIVSEASPVGAGMQYLEVNELVNKDLAKRNLLYREESHTHSVAHCWRCHTRLFYNPQNAWYVDIQKLKSSMKKNNEVVNWFPKHFKYGRFLKSMEAAPDWCISRSRYWGSPVPVWECECGERYVPGSIEELEKLSGKKISELHKPEIDEVTIKCENCGEEAKRVAEVLDSWIEAGSASFAERHFPFDKKIKLGDFFPPDFIVEYTGQIRAWFYVLHVIATALYDSNAFRNVVVTGVILGTDGRKMSKNFGNYPDPKEMIQKYGGDALRLYLMGAPVMRGEDIKISEEDYRNQVKDFMLILWNVYSFFVTYSNLDDWKPGRVERFVPSNVLDKWILSRLRGSIEGLEEKYEKFDTPEVVNLARNFIVKDLSGWYVRRIRERVGPVSKDEKGKGDAYQTLWTVLILYSKALSPLIPFLAEEIYKNLTKEESVHLSDWPSISEKFDDKSLEKEMEEKVRNVVEVGHALRKEKSVPVRQALASFTTTCSKPSIEVLEELVKDEVNVLEVKWGGKKDLLDTKITPKLKAMGEARKLVREIQSERKRLNTNLDEEVDVSLPSWPNEFEDYIRNKAQVKNISKGKFKVLRLK